MRSDAKQVLVPDDAGPLGWLSRRSYLVFEIRKHAYLSREKQSGFFPWDASPDFAPAWQADTWPRQKAELSALRESVAAVGSRLAVVVVPYEPQLGTKYLDHDREYTLAPQRNLAAVCEELGIPLLDVHGAFFRERETRLYKDGDPVHLTPRGHALLADLVLAFVADEGLVRE